MKSEAKFVVINNYCTLISLIKHMNNWTVHISCLFWMNCLSMPCTQDAQDIIKNIKGDKNNKIMVYFESSVDWIVLKAII